MFNLFQTEKNRMKLNYCILLKYDRKTDKKRNPAGWQFDRNMKEFGSFCKQLFL